MMTVFAGFVGLFFVIGIDGVWKFRLLVSSGMWRAGLDENGNGLDEVSRAETLPERIKPLVDVSAAVSFIWLIRSLQFLREISDVADIV